MQKIQTKLLLILWSLCFSISASATDLTRDYLSVFSYAQKHQKDDFVRERKSFNDPSLTPYLDFAWLYYNIEHIQQKQLDQFLKQYPNLAVNPILEKKWLNKLAKEQKWSAFLQNWQPRLSSKSLQCKHAMARIKTGGTASLRSELENLWLSGQSLPKTCDEPLKYFKKQGWQTQTLIWQRFELAMRSNQLKLAHWLASLLSTQQNLAKQWIRIRKQSDQIQSIALTMPAQSTQTQDILAYEISKLARKKPALARASFLALKKHIPFSENQSRNILQQTALFAATDNLPEANAWLQQSLKQQEHSGLRRWAFRLALRAQNWPAVIEAFQHLSLDDQNLENWQYWLARAYHETGQTQRALASFKTLSNQSNYYGFLAADKLDTAYSLCPKTSQLELTLFNEALDNIHLKRALALYQAEQFHYARMEWQLAIRNARPKLQHQMALIAAESGWHEKAISTLASQGAMKHYTQRFPFAHETAVEKAARRHQLPTSLIYAIIRAESAFAADASSSVGAKGLMQIMPAIGKQLARKMGWSSNWRTDLLFQPDRNILMGTLHFSDYLNRLGQQTVHTIAAYNAGPHNVEKWNLRTPNLDSDIWIDTIPYKDTRSYIRQVLAFSVIYEWRQHRKSRRISDWFSPITQPSKHANQVTIPVYCRGQTGA